MKNEDNCTLAQEYSAHIKALDETITDCRKALKKAKEQRRRHIISKLNSNIAALYRQRRELIEIRDKLNAYYEAQEDKKVG